jgi:hypothetical protein
MEWFRHVEFVAAARREIRPDGTRDLASRVDRTDLVVDVPDIDLYALVVSGGDGR